MHSVHAASRQDLAEAETKSGARTGYLATPRGSQGILACPAEKLAFACTAAAAGQQPGTQ
jgi:hypothetical protein